MYWLNKCVWFVANPAVVGCVALLVAILSITFGGEKRKRMRRAGVFLVGFSLVWFYVWSTPVFTKVVGLPLEKSYLSEGRFPAVEDFPVCDAIVDLGGGVGAHTNLFAHPTLNSSADRAYFSALLWRSGKAPVIIPSGVGVECSDKAFLLDLGIPETSIVVENRARNTEGNATEIATIVSTLVEGRKPRVLVVTSAWHMKRAMLMFERYAPQIEAIPAACDFECSMGCGLTFSDFLPSPETFGRNAIYFHEWLGYWGYKYLRK
ncbi:MAG: YdcF family protein [Kiritimatiellae bacterium]|nr:YdcF family protein [Kiritimatiellia bacterium]